VYWHSKTSAAKRESTSRKIGNGIESNSAIIGSEIVGTLSASDAKQISNQYVNENKCVVEPLLVDGTRNDDLRLYEDGIVRTMRARMGTGGGNTPTVLVPTLSFDTQFGSNAGVFEDQSPTLKSSQQSPSVLQEPLTYDGYNQTLSDDGIHRSLWIGRDSSDFIAQEENKSEEVSPQFAIRRLTPLECERLMGWPDNWTEGQSDSHRYKQCGNGVASPVAEWIGEQVLKIWSKHE
jgi:DNA (cytosine-5)-methyltransferase 1